MENRVHDSSIIKFDLKNKHFAKMVATPLYIAFKPMC